MLNLGCHSYSLRRHERSAALALLRTAGFERTELWAGHAPYQPTLPRAASAERVTNEARDAGVTLAAYSIGGLFGLPQHAVRDRLEAAFAYAGELGVGLVTGIVDRRALPLADTVCTRYGMRFAAENHWYTEMARPEDYAALQYCSPAVGVALDTGHFAFLGYDLEAVARELGARTFTVHLKAVRPVNPMVRMLRRQRKRFGLEPALPRPGDGLAECLVALEAQRYGGLVAVEHEHAQGHGSGDELEALGAYRRHAQATLEAAHA